MEVIRTSLTRRPEAVREPHLASWYAPGMQDALGDRLLLCDNTDGDPLEMLRLRAHLTKPPQFESRLRAQAQILKGFQSAAFAPIHSVERLEEGGTLAIVSSHVPGVRLSEVLSRAVRGRRPLPVDAALFIVGQLVQAVASLHAHTGGLTHGALAPERVILTAHGTVVVVEHALGAALAELGYDRQRFWRELRLGTVAGSTAATRDPRTDVLQVGLIAIATILGRPLTAGDFPQGIAALLAEAGGVLTRGHGPADAALDWLSRALQESGPASFGSATEAAAAFPASCGVVDPETTGAAQRQPERVWPTEEIVRSSAGVGALVPRHVFANPGNVEAGRRVRIPLGAAVAIAAAALVLGGAASSLVGDDLAALDVSTMPSGATVRIDGRTIGVTPLRQVLEPGTYELELSKDGEVRTFTIPLRANGERTQYVEMTARPPAGLALSGESLVSRDVPVRPLAARTDPSAPVGSVLVSSPVDLEMFHDGRFLGVSGESGIAVPAGQLKLELVNRELDFRTTANIFVEPGRQRTLALAAPLGVLRLTAPPGAEVWIDGRLAGETPLDAVQLPLGTHRVSLRHPELGAASEDVIVKASGPARVSIALRPR